jgi:hypothetical protein
MNRKQQARQRAAERRAAPKEDRLEKDPKTGRFLPGNSGFGGRPKGARNKLTETVVHTLGEDFARHGAAVIEQVRKERPHDYLKVVAAILPRQQENMEMVINKRAEDMTDDELATIAAMGRPKQEEADELAPTSKNGNGWGP